MKYFKATGSPIAILAHQKYNLLEPFNFNFFALDVVVFNHEQREWGTQSGWFAELLLIGFGRSTLVSKSNDQPLAPNSLHNHDTCQFQLV